MYTRLSNLLLPICAAASCAPMAWGQASDRPIDQAVEDLDPRAVSFRVVDPGNAQFPTRSMVIERAHAASWTQLGVPALDQVQRLTGGRQYEYRAPGVRAMMNRPDYIALDQTGRPGLNVGASVDGAFVELAPPDTIYRLTPDAPRPIDPAAIDPSWQDARVDGRVNYRLDQAAQTPAHAYDPDTISDAQRINHQGRSYIIRKLHSKRYDDQTKADDQAHAPTDRASADDAEPRQPEAEASDSRENKGEPGG